MLGYSHLPLVSTMCKVSVWLWNFCLIFLAEQVILVSLFKYLHGVKFYCVVCEFSSVSTHVMCESIRLSKMVKNNIALQSALNVSTDKILDTVRFSVDSKHLEGKDTKKIPY